MFSSVSPFGYHLVNDTALMLAGLIPLAAILLAAVRAELRQRCIPNHVVLLGMVIGLLLHTILPPGNGFLTQWRGGIGPWLSLLGLVIGALALLPLYCLRVVGSGDVRLMATVGAFLGPYDLVPALCGSFLAGTLAALAGEVMQPPADEAPYSPAVAVGTLIGVLWVVAAGRV